MNSRTMIVWSRRCAGADDRHGHADLLARRSSGRPAAAAGRLVVRRAPPEMSVPQPVELLVHRLGVMEVALVGGEVRRHRAVGQPVGGADRDRSKIESTSSLVTASCVRPFTRAAKRRPTRSSQPQRRSRPVTVPYSPPCSRIARRPLLVGLAGERPGADAGQVGLGDAEHAVDPGRADAEAGAGAAGDRVGAGDERIGAVVEVEQRAPGRPRTAPCGPRPAPG